MLSLSMGTVSFAPRTAFSRIGTTRLHGPHHGAQKSTMTGWSNDASTTSVMKFAVVTSLTTAAAGVGLLIPPPIKFLSGIFVSRSGREHNMAAGRRDDKRRRRGSAFALRNFDNPRGMTAGFEKASEVGGR